MKIKQISLFELESSEVIRKVDLNSNLNYVTSYGDLIKNKIGKTTFLKLIDICFGAREIENIYFDTEKNTPDLLLKEHINNRKICVKMILEDNTSLEVHLYDGDKVRKINGDKLGEAAYNKFLGEKFLGDIPSSVSFRDIIKKFNRVPVKDEKVEITNFLYSNATKDKYIAMYNYLFDLEDNEQNSQKDILRKNLKKIEADIKYLKKINGFKDIEDIITMKKVLEQRAESIKSELSKYDDKELDTIENRQELKLEYNSLSQKLEKNKYLINKYTDMIEAILAQKLENEEIKNMYDTLQVNFQLKREFDELVIFNELLNKEKIKMYKMELSCLESSNEKMIKDIKKIENENKFSWEKDTKEMLEDYGRLYNVLIDIEKQLSLRDETIKKYNVLDTEKSNIENELLGMDNANNDNIKTFNKIFSKCVENVLGEVAYLTFDINKRKKEMIQIHKMTAESHGTLKVLQILFDIAYIIYAEKIGKKTPKFVIVDVLESSDEMYLSKINEYVVKYDIQFITSILHTSLEKIDNITEDDIILRLSADDKLFKI